MLFTKGLAFKTRLLFSQTARFLNSNLMPNFSQFSIEPKFNDAEQEKILNILNESNKDQLQCLNVAQTNIKRLENYKKRNGPFKSLNELLEVDGLSVKMLEKMCKQLISDSTNSNVKTTNENKKMRQILTPQLPASTHVSTAVGIHLAPMGVSWAKLSGNQLESWGYEDFTNLPKKMFSTDTFKLALGILNQIPTGDAYIFEGTSSMGLQGQKQSSAVPPYTQQLELCSMLLALINTSSSHNTVSQDADSDADITNCVYFLRSKLPARMFKTLVGNECVSCTSVILHLLGDSPDGVMLPCSSITFEEKLKSDYLGKSPAHKELLGQALMLVIAFMDLCVRKNPVSIKAIAPNRK
ncbi:uncharacterized protein LOC103313039 [Tribolium castaneum]|uniref:Transcription elongation factor, mitochondrial-like Protein n=1 Tax=Tribolium castaneum TaxID=7070 RepID=D6WF54_TRICA|nr:PREDICTED: uncharacterized protein LOC103313039 [Tribolium castaneum]EEZ99841.2 Transcription elongation factor, mitochondrial-like Protein [Tribolium castaneum]|eukprot:XP_015833846.1 PREDICTED: uncharacterized protein LOC103313039 [Tribolium castaneum]